MPAEVGYIVDSCADDRDLFALVYEFAQQGLLTIEAKGSEDRPEVVLHKKADIPQTAPDYQRTFFQALFGKKQEFSFAHAGERFAQKLAEAKTQLAQHFDGENKLYQPGTAAASLVLPLLAAGLFLAGMVLAGRAFAGRRHGAGRRERGLCAGRRAGGAFWRIPLAVCCPRHAPLPFPLGPAFCCCAPRRAHFLPR